MKAYLEGKYDLVKDAFCVYHFIASRVGKMRSIVKGPGISKTVERSEAIAVGLSQTLLFSRNP